MAEIYRIGSDDLIDRVSTFGGTNLMRASGCSDWDAQYYATDQGFEFMGDRVKIPAGKNFRSNWNIKNPYFSYKKNTPILFSFYIYENTLTSTNTNAQLNLRYTGYRSTGSIQSGYSFDLNSQGFIHFSTTFSNDDNFYDISLSIDIQSATSGYLIIGPRQVELNATKPTNWTPSPYDLVTYDSSSESLVFFQ